MAIRHEKKWFGDNANFIFLFLLGQWKRYCSCFITFCMHSNVVLSHISRFSMQCVCFYC